MIQIEKTLFYKNYIEHQSIVNAHPIISFIKRNKSLFSSAKSKNIEEFIYYFDQIDIDEKMNLFNNITDFIELMDNYNEISLDVCSEDIDNIYRKCHSKCQGEF